MRKLKKIISTYMNRITWILVAVILVIALYSQRVNEQRRAYENATRTFSQIEQVLAENQKELEEIQEEYRQTCLYNAEAIARMIESDPDVMDSRQELKEIADIMEVDEIHVFDKTGRIFTGTHPQYYDYTFESGEQMMFFKPMLEDKTLKLVQDISPNTAEGKMMQYSALWSNNGEFIVQVGMEPVNVMKVTEKNELSYLFALFRVNPKANYYAIDAESGEIVGSTNLESVGCNLTEVGFSLDDVAHDEDGFFATVGGRNSFCVFEKIDTNYIGRVVSTQDLYERVPAFILLLFIGLTTIALFLSNAVTRHMNKYVVDEIHGVNEKLELIANGNLEEIVDIQSSVEFAELSNYINMMVKSLLANNKKMSYVLSKTNLYIGVYEYNNRMKKIRFTEYVPQILCLDSEQMEQLSSDRKEFQKFIQKIGENPVPDEPGVFQLSEQPERYIRLEESNNADEVFGVVIDVTDEIMKRKKVEGERDHDALTGLYNRRGLETQLRRLFANPEMLGYSALLMIDADGLKGINDTYGHDAGDLYLKEIAEVINNFGPHKSVAARQGGDEFVLFVYGYESQEKLIRTIETLEYIQNHSSVKLNEKQSVILRFSFGYCLTSENSDYQKALKEADERMYQNKTERKKANVASPN